MTEAPTLYVYAVVPDGDYTPSTTGIDGAPLHLVPSGTGISAVVHEHTSAPYDGPDDTVKRWVLEHSDVVENAWDGAGAVLPVSFNVIVRGDSDTGASATEQLTAWLTTAQGTLRTRLDQLAGTSELRVEISLDRSTYVADDPEITQLRSEMADRSPGVRRLYEKRLEKAEKELADRAADALYPALRPRLAAHCLEVQEYRAPVREPGLVPVVTASCLVRSDATRDLGAELTAIQSENPAAVIRFLGPWPPYSFADLEGAQAPPAAATT